ncbi:MAG TPA: hypothetical protein VF802_05340 [Candidatus Limnocylindrales bacterium]
MTRDELLLAALTGGEASTATLSRATGLGERRARAGIAHLTGVGYVWSPVRGRYRLTARGRTISAEIGFLPPADRSSDKSTSRPDPATVDIVL